MLLRVRTVIGAGRSTAPDRVRQAGVHAGIEGGEVVAVVALALEAAARVGVEGLTGPGGRVVEVPDARSDPGNGAALLCGREAVA